MHHAGNFPQGLDIRPSSHLNLHSFPPDAFSDESSRSDDDQQAIESFGIAGRTWEAAYALKVYLTCPSLPFDVPFRLQPNEPKTIVDVGSGTGYLSLALARHLNHPDDLLIMTDLEEVVPLLERNLDGARLTSSGAVLVRPLPWGDDAALSKLGFEILNVRKPTHVLASDLVYFPSLYPPLLRTLIALVNDERIELVMSYKTRSLAREQPFWNAFGAWFEMRPVMIKDRDGTWKRFGAEDDIYVFVCRRKVDTLGKTIPLDDETLMQGNIVDEQFETMLLADLDPYDDNDETDAGPETTT